MNRCPITYEPLPEGTTYSQNGLKLLNRNLASLAPLEFTAEQQRQADEEYRRYNEAVAQDLRQKGFR